MNEKSNKKKPQIIIGSFGQPVPESVLEKVKKITDIFDKITPEYETDDQNLPDKMTNFRDAITFVKAISESTIEKLRKSASIIDKFLSSDPDETITGEELIRMVLAMDMVVDSIKDIDEIYSHLSDTLKILSTETIIGAKETTYGELLDGEQMSDENG